MKAIFLFLIALIQLVNLSSVSAEDFSKELTKWKTEAKAHPKSALAYFNLAVMYTKVSKYKLAVLAYNRVIELNSPLAPVARYYKALIFAEHGQPDVAKKIISEIQLDDIPSNLKKRVLELKNQLFVDSAIEEEEQEEAEAATKNSNQSEKKFYIYLDFGLGENSNPASVSSPTGTGLSSDRLTQLKLSSSYLLSADKESDFKFIYSYLGSFYAADVSYNYYYNLLSLPYSFYFSESRIKISPEFYSDSFGNQAYSQSTGGTFEYALKMGDDYWGFNIHAASLYNVSSVYYYLTGTQERFQTYYEWRWSSSKLLLSVGYNQYKYQDLSTLSSSYTSYPLSFAYSEYFRNYDYTFSFGEEVKIYPQATVDPFARMDNRVFAAFHIDYNLSNQTQFYTEISIVQNQSNFNGSSVSTNDSYSQTIFLIGTILSGIW